MTKAVNFHHFAQVMHENNFSKKIGKPTRGRGYVGYKLVLDLDSDDEDFEANSI